MIKVAIMGCTGRMGSAVARQVIGNKDFQLVSGTARKESEYLGQDLGKFLKHDPLGISITCETKDAIEVADVVIDFTTPEAAVRHALAAADLGKPYVTGTTGLSKNLQQDIVNASEKIPIVFSPNMSIGITLLISMVERAARVLDDSFDIEICEMHHRYKLDAPSGTAISLGHAAAKGRHISLEEKGVRARTGKRNKGEIGFAVLRGGEVAGDHKVIFAGNHEILELSHRALDRTVFASGALKAAEWVVTQKPGLYNMHDVLSLDSNN